MPKKSSPFYYPLPELQSDAVLSQANPVSGTKYTVLDTTPLVRLKTIAARCTWTVQPDPLEVHLTIDGNSFIADFTDPVSNTKYYVGLRDPFAAEGYLLNATNLSAYRAFLLEGRSIKVEAEITGGTVSALDCRVKYLKW